MNCRSMESSKKRGGLVVFIKRNILSGITLIDKSSSEMMWFKLSGAFFGSPVNSTYVKKNHWIRQTSIFQA